MLLYLSLSGALLSVLLIYYNGRRYKSSIYLGIFFFLVSLYSFTHYVILDSKSVFWVKLSYVHTTFLFYLTGPMSYFYIRSVLTDDVRLRKSDWWHCIPSLIYLFSVGGYLFKPWSYKLEIATSIVQDYEFIAVHQVNYISQLLGTALPVYLSRPVLALGYTVTSLFMFMRYLRQHKEGGPVFRHRLVMKRWLGVFIMFQFVVFLGFALFMLSRWPGSPLYQFFSAHDLEMVTAIGLMGLLLAPVFFPQILYGLPDFERKLPVSNRNEAIPQVEDEATENNESADPKSTGLQLEPTYLDSIGKRIEEAMQSDRPYTQEDFNLLKLSHLINIPAHHLGIYFRELRQQSFNDYRNECRIEYAKQLLRSGKAAELTLEAIGKQVGFASKSVFFKAFKKVTGDTPGKFIGQENGGSVE